MISVSRAQNLTNRSLQIWIELDLEAKKTTKLEIQRAISMVEMEVLASMNSDLQVNEAERERLGEREVWGRGLRGDL